MAAWYITALKAVLPHIGTIIESTLPVFTKKNTDTAVNQTVLLQQQITELQSTAFHNAAHIKELAEQLQSTVATLEKAGSVAEGKLQRALVLSSAAVMISVIALSVAMFSIFTQ